MPAADLLIRDSARGASRSAGNQMVILGPASGGTANTVYSFDSDSLVPDTLGNGAAVELAMATIRESGQRTHVVPLNTTIAGTIGAVTETPAGPGPAITVAATTGDEGPYDTLDCAVKITTAGALGAGRFRVS